MAEIPEFKNLIDGEIRKAASGEVMDSINPATGEVWARIPRGSAEDAVAAVDAAKQAFPSWSALPPEGRSEYLKRVAEVFVEHGDELARLESIDNGNPLTIMELTDGPAMKTLWNRKAHETLQASTGRTVPLDSKTLGLTIREPYGVVAAIVPFNMPVAMLSNKIGGALAAGNTVVAKPPEQASAGCLRLGELLNDVLPPGTVNIVAGLGDVGDAMVRHRER